jgi:hypothetical protein
MQFYGSYDYPTDARLKEVPIFWAPSRTVEGYNGSDWQRRSETIAFSNFSHADIYTFPGKYYENINANYGN